MNNNTTKTVLGLSFGRKNGNSDVLVKEALFQCKEQGYKINFINVNSLEIKPCSGCVSCVVGMVTGRGKGGCPLKDDFHILDEALMESDAVIVACPTFVLSPTGLFKTVCDRIGPSHDITFRKVAYDEGKAAGKDESQLLDARSFKNRVGALISVGGAITKNWLSFMLPTMYEITMSMGIDVVDMHEYFGAMEYESVVGNEKEIQRAQVIGQNIVDALLAETEEERVKWRGEEEGTCPVCHCDMISISRKKRDVECPVCGIRGVLDIVDDEIKVTFSEAEQQRSRLRWAGKLEHSTEIKTHSVGPGQIPDLKEKMKKYSEI